MQFGLSRTLPRCQLSIADDIDNTLSLFTWRHVGCVRYPFLHHEWQRLAITLIEFGPKELRLSGVMHKSLFIYC